MSGRRLSNTVNYGSILDLDLSEGEYMDKLDALLREARFTLIERRKIIRQKVQVFKDLKRKNPKNRAAFK